MPRHKQSHCKQGHELTPENISWYLHTVSGKPQRKCRICRNAAVRQRYKTNFLYREKLKRKSQRRRSRPPADLYLAAWGILRSEK